MQRCCAANFSKIQWPLNECRRRSRIRIHPRIVFSSMPGWKSDQNLPEQGALTATRPHSFSRKTWACADPLLAAAASHPRSSRCAIATDTRCDETLVARGHHISAAKVISLPPSVDPPRFLDNLWQVHGRPMPCLRQDICDVCSSRETRRDTRLLSKNRKISQ